MKTISSRQDTTSMNASFNGAALDVSHLEGFAIEAKWTESSATLAGTLKVQVSNTAFLNNVYQQEDPNAVWSDIAGSSVAVSGSGTQMWNVSSAYYKACRVVWTRTSGQGSIVVTYWAKGVI